MATKKTAEEVANVSDVKESTKKTASTIEKATTKKTTKKVESDEDKSVEKKTTTRTKKTKPVVDPVVEPVKEEIKVEEVKSVAPKAKVEPAKKSNVYKVIAPNGTYIYQGPGITYAKIKTAKLGANLVIVEKQGNWGKLSNSLWVNLSPNLVENV